MSKSKYVVLSIAAVAVIGAFALHSVAAQAAGSATTSDSLAAKIAQAFGLDQSKVQSVISQYRQGQASNSEARYTSMLQQAVTNGKLTSSQEQAILTEHATLESQLQSAMTQTGSGRRSAMQNVRSEAAAWAKSNDISVRWLLGQRPLRGMGSHYGTQPQSTASPTPTPTPSASPLAGA